MKPLLSANDSAAVQIRQLGLVDYADSLQAMLDFTAQRDAATPDEIWLCEHLAVFTQGQAGKPEHLLLAGDIPLIASNRGGQITFHGLGQVVAYALIDLKRAGYFIKEYVYRIEDAVLKTLAHVGVTGHRVAGAPGIYVRPAPGVPTHFHDIGIRIEDDALVSAQGCELLSRGVPVQADAIEALMKD